MSNSPTFLGTWQRAIDQAGSLSLPQAFRRQVADGLIVTVGFERCLQVYPLGAWEVFKGAVAGLPMGMAQARALRRFLFANAVEAELDDQGRLRLPAHLQTYAGIARAAVLAGMDHYFEIWSGESWHRVAEGLLQGPPISLPALPTVASGD